MPVPDFQSMMLPFLQLAADGEEHDLSEAADYLATHFKLSYEDRDELLPSGNQSRLDNRVGWIRTHFKNAGLIEYVRRGIFRITKRGQEVLAKKPTAINLKFLDQFPEHFEWFHREREETEQAVASPSVTVTPEEQMEFIAKDLKKKLGAELLERVKAMNPFRFERVVLDLLLAMGYGGSREEAATVTHKSGDEGIDGLINEDRLGLDCIYVQAKRWQNSVGRPEVQSFVGALDGKRADKGIFITTSNFSPGAIEFIKSISKRVILIDGARLAELMIQHNVGIAPAYAYEIKKLTAIILKRVS
jgi:restriction system protein